MAGVMKNEEIRKGPWTEQEDVQLLCHVGLIGDRRWDFIAKVSGLNRTGKSCRLRWVNYLHPGLKRGRMTPQEERLILELHDRWGNRWSHIARKLPGRTDNEIKNYWRTLMRKKAQEKKKNSDSHHSSSSSTSSSSSILTSLAIYNNQKAPATATVENSYYHEINSANDLESFHASAELELEGIKGYPMDQIWKEIETSESAVSGLGFKGSMNHLFSPVWEYSYVPLWKMDDPEDLIGLYSASL